VLGAGFGPILYYALLSAERPEAEARNIYFTINQYLNKSNLFEYLLQVHQNQGKELIGKLLNVLIHLTILLYYPY
jgi:hypothetical protein